MRKQMISLLKRCSKEVPLWIPCVGWFRLNLFTHRGYWFYGKRRSINEWDTYLELIDKGHVVFDIGGHIGFLSRLFIKLIGPDGFLVSVEPSVENFRLLKRNLKAFGNAECLNCGCSSRHCQMELWLDPVGGFCSSFDSYFFEEKLCGLNLSLDTELEKGDRDSVGCVPVDYLAEKFGQPDFMKIDVEGHELHVLKGAKKTLRGLRALMVEISVDAEKTHALLRETGFVVYRPVTRAAEVDLNQIPEVGNVFFINEAFFNSAPSFSDTSAVL